MDIRRWRHFDYILLIVSLILAGYGIAMIYSATLATYGNQELSIDVPVMHQAFFVLVGLILMLVFTTIDYRIYASLYYPLYGLNIFLLVLVLVVGSLGGMGDSRRWIDLVLFDFQPSEMAKLLLILTLAQYLARRREQTGRWLSWPALLGSLVHVGVLLPLIFFEPDLGTTLVLVAIWLGMVFVAGAPWWRLLFLGALGVLAVPFAWLYVLRDYMRERFLVFLNPYLDPWGAGYNYIQSRVSVGGGGLWGQGFTNGSQSQLHFLRIQHTDYIFSVLAEELGFVGAIVLSVLFLILLWRILRIGQLARDTYGRLIAAGLVSMLLFQFVVNVGMNVGLFPVTGITLPFISYGGNSVLPIFIGLGILQNILMHHRRLEF
ncbi:MAG: rod shape-determining protein RodA [Chloroflexi bacterium]|nr:rod shape-determining protein RodA [Chloroflexota bacterium]MBU1747897.1 rod shape-determining protein RodA [Chloroflexota bacterium]MBU1878651.1 rod shape-determining protein RodA [Chloroflexota bacterium]